MGEGGGRASCWVSHISDLRPTRIRGSTRARATHSSQGRAPLASRSHGRSLSVEEREGRATQERDYAQRRAGLLTRAGNTCACAARHGDGAHVGRCGPCVMNAARVRAARVEGRRDRATGPGRRQPCARADAEHGCPILPVTRGPRSRRRICRAHARSLIHAPRPRTTLASRPRPGTTSPLLPPPPTSSGTRRACALVSSAVRTPERRPDISSMRCFRGMPLSLLQSCHSRRMRMRCRRCVGRSSPSPPSLTSTSPHSRATAPRGQSTSRGLPPSSHPMLPAPPRALLSLCEPPCLPAPPPRAATRILHGTPTVRWIPAVNAPARRGALAVHTARPLPVPLRGARRPRRSPPSRPSRAPSLPPSPRIHSTSRRSPP